MPRPECIGRPADTTRPFGPFESSGLVDRTPAVDCVRNWSPAPSGAFRLRHDFNHRQSIKRTRLLTARRGWARRAAHPTNGAEGPNELPATTTWTAPDATEAPVAARGHRGRYRAAARRRRGRGPGSPGENAEHEA